MHAPAGAGHRGPIGHRPPAAAAGLGNWRTGANSHGSSAPMRRRAADQVCLSAAPCQARPYRATLAAPWRRRSAGAGLREAASVRRVAAVITETNRTQNRKYGPYLMQINSIPHFQ
jgi:hypothetical protein